MKSEPQKIAKNYILGSKIFQKHENNMYRAVGLIPQFLKCKKIRKTNFNI